MLAVSKKLMPTSKAARVQASVCSRSTPPEYVSQEPSEIAETSISESPSLRNSMPATLPECVGGQPNVRRAGLGRLISGKADPRPVWDPGNGSLGRARMHCE